jgi:hypothetical protein
MVRPCGPSDDVGGRSWSAQVADHIDDLHQFSENRSRKAALSFEVKDITSLGTSGSTSAAAADSSSVSAVPWERTFKVSNQAATELN